MLWIAFTIGLFGSLHCLGMCGPLAFALLPGVEKGGWSNHLRVISYNIGRVISYAGLGIFAGLASSAFDLAGLQKPLSLILGILMILLFTMSLDIEKLLNNSSKYREVFDKYRRFLSKMLSRFTSMNSLSLGMLNGLLPCGLVYLALAGSLTSGSISNSIVFMVFFGLGTFPAMITLLNGASLVSKINRLRLRKSIAYLQLVVGIFLICRAVSVELPSNLELYWSVGKVMCH